MKQVLFKTGKVVIEDVPAPHLKANEVLVENLFSLISSGTEMASLNFSRQPLPLKILRYPTKLAKGLRLVKEKGVLDAYKIVQGMLATGVTPGYSSCGRIIKKGKEVTDLKVGDLVSCAGANIASHAEFIAVPRNLVVTVPPGVLPEEAASATVGAIALQGVRQADLRVGESAVVIGLGLIGQLVCQILLSSGIKVIGIDGMEERLRFAKSKGVAYSFSSQRKNLIEEIIALTNSYGADATIICASNPQDNNIINEAMQLTRKRGKVVVVGDIGLKIERTYWYEKEIDLRISTSYGPGRGDPAYEIEGKDYPYAYVRWTENRNMEAYLELLANKKIDFLSLIGGRYSLLEAEMAFKLLQSDKKPFAVLLSYPQSLTHEKESSTFVSLAAPAKIEGKIEVGIIGLGGFAKTVLLPNFLKLKNDFHIRGICTHKAAEAKYFAQKSGSQIATTNYEDLLADPKINLIVISTRHNTHASLVEASLKASKNVFVEKPLCLTLAELEKLDQLVKEPKEGFNPLVMVGFNRRFSPFVNKIMPLIENRHNPLEVYYVVNDNYLPPSHWVNTQEGGGRILGNACHMFDLFCYLTQSRVKKIQASAIFSSSNFYLPTDNFISLIQFQDGSLATLFYSTQGSEKLPKEQFSVFSEGKVLTVNNFTKLESYGVKANMKTFASDKGHLAELEELAQSLKQRKWPIPWEEIVEATKISLEVDKQVREQI